MNPEVCPFCGKSYKRLKSHLPFCKAAKPPLSHPEPVASPQSGQLQAHLPKTKGKKKTALGEVTPKVPVKSGKMTPSSKKKSFGATMEATKTSHISPGSDSASQSLTTATKFTASSKPKSTSKKTPIKSPEQDIMAVRKEIPRITLQHVGSTLGRTKTNRPAIHIETTLENTKSKTGLSSSSSSASSILQPEESRLLPKDNSYRSKATMHMPPLLPDRQTSKVGFQQTEQISMLPVHFSNLQSRPEETVATMKLRKDNSSERRLGQVTLRELPEWLACRTPRCPGDAVVMMQRGWQWYYRKYIDVRKGGVGGLGMLLAGYCVLSYVWSYPHLKHDRWRKYH